MKKISLLVVLIISIFVFDLRVFGATTTLSVSSNTVTVGDSFTVYANMKSAAAWNIHVTSSGPVSGCSINQADSTEDALDTSKTFSATCTATGEGTIVITLSGDVISSSDENSVIISGSTKVTVNKKVVSSTPSTSNASVNSNTSVNSNDNLSTNNNIKNIEVEGYDLVKVDSNNYNLSVSNNITSVNVKVTAEDNDAKVSGDGTHEISVGENNIEVIVTAPSGAENKINIKVTRKDGYYLEDLSSVLKNNSIKDINIIIDDDSKLTTEDLANIKQSKKTVNLNYYDENKNLIYSWIIKGTKIDDVNEFLTSISYTLDYPKEVGSLSNYASGLYLTIKQEGNIPNGVKLKLYVGDKFDSGSLVNVYYYDKDNDKLGLSQSDLMVTDGYVELLGDKGANYLITMAKIDNEIETNVTTNNIFKKLFIIETAIVIGGVIVCGVKKIKEKKKKVNQINN
jgi:hypothetical protein